MVTERGHKVVHVFLRFLNDNHWYIVAVVILSSAIFWSYGCESKVSSLLDNANLVNRAQLENELQYLIGEANAKIANLNKQDEIKQALLDAANIVGQGGQINPSGLLNIAASVGGIAFGLSQRQKYRYALQKANRTTTEGGNTDTT